MSITKTNEFGAISMEVRCVYCFRCCSTHWFDNEKDGFVCFSCYDNLKEKN